MKANHEVCLQLLIVHHQGHALIAKYHFWDIPYLAHDRPPLYALPDVVVHLSRGDCQAFEVKKIIADTQ
jgi:hypothetical protein